ncbi:MAG: GldG family protein [Christensenellaceae bacterium]|jgi:ABC-type uncharacterized transport system involved in gliding motility auxiliary subunit|nr:GldG family protein [Christensenellaceae bacterium]
MKMPKIFQNTKLRRGGASVLLALLAIVAAVLINLAASLLDSRFGLSLDLSRNKMFSISDQTVKTVKALGQPVEIYALASQGSEDLSISQMLENYRRLNPDLIKVSNVDPVANPAFATQFGGVNLSQNSLVVTNPDRSKVRLINYTEMFELSYDQNTYQSYPRAFIGEQKLTNALLFVTAETITNAYFLSGHGEVELSGLSHLMPYLESENLQVSSLPGTELSRLTKDDILFVASPRVDLIESEQAEIKTFLENQGRMVYMVEPGSPELPYFESLLDLYNVKFNHDFVVETDADRYYGNPSQLVPNIGNHQSAVGVKENNQIVLLPSASSFSQGVVQSKKFAVEPTLTTSAGAYGKTNLEATTIEKEEGDLSGPLDLSLVIRQIDEEGNDSGTKIVLVGSMSFVGSSSFSGINIDFFMGSVKWLMGQSDTVTIIGKSMVGNTLRFTSATQIYVLAALVILVVPLLVLCFGTILWMRRRHL